MTRHNPFRGFGIALATPFQTDGSIDTEALRALIESQLSGGVDFLCVLGTTAETPTLSDEEKRLVRRIALETVAGRVPLLLGAGGNCTADVCRFLREEDLSGFQGVLIVCPYYNKPSQEGLYQHFRAVCGASPLPVVLYNVPGRTGANLQPDTVLRIARDCPQAVAIKEASGRILQAEEILAAKPDGFDVLCGDDALTCAQLALGAAGVISVVGNALPYEFAELVHAAQRGELAQALELHHRFRRFYKLMMADGNPAGVKCLLALQGKALNVLRLPLVPASDATQEGIRQALDEF
ncbi:MAG: 4-hydroxy-tetrahydrodipicolinate synthase [Alloprevotella sp.]|nr:4-hydroxy-tetrahydrodipicolinate synthase [Alloprevotella sp.]